MTRITRKRTLAATLMITLALCLLVAAHTSAKRDNTVIDNTFIALDDIAYSDNGEEFANAFASEPLCSGLSLVTYTSGPFQYGATFRGAGWLLSYYTMPDIFDRIAAGSTTQPAATAANGSQPTQPQGDIAVDVAGVSLNRQGVDGKVTKGISKKDGAATPRDAAHWVCFVVKEKGGKLLGGYYAY